MIDWFTVSAQIINFLILVFLLKRFLYGPVIRAMDKREEAIAGRLKDAGQKQEEAQKEIDRYRFRILKRKDHNDEDTNYAKAKMDSSRRILFIHRNITMLLTI